MIDTCTYVNSVYLELGIPVHWMVIRINRWYICCCTFTWQFCDVCLTHSVRLPVPLTACPTAAGSKTNSTGQHSRNISRSSVRSPLHTHIVLSLRFS